MLSNGNCQLSQQGKEEGGHRHIGRKFSGNVDEERDYWDEQPVWDGVENLHVIS